MRCYVHKHWYVYEEILFMPILYEWDMWGCMGVHFDMHKYAFYMAINGN